MVAECMHCGGGAHGALGDQCLVSGKKSDSSVRRDGYVVSIYQPEE